MSYPTTIPSYIGFTTTHTLAQDMHAAQHNLEQADLVAIGTKLGTGGSVPTNNTVLRGNGSGTTVYDQIHLATDVNGILATQNGGTGTNMTTGTGSTVYATAPTLSNPTISGGGSWAGAPTISQPTISDFSNANHGHQNSAGGGQLLASAISSLDLTNTTFKNPYKFSVYRNDALNTSIGTTVAVAYDTKNFDTSSNVDVVTNKGRFTAPINGFYFLTANVEWASVSTTAGILLLFKNGVNTGTQIGRGSDRRDTSTNKGMVVSAFVQLTAGDYVEVAEYCDATVAHDVGAASNNQFEGFLVSTT